MRRSEQREHIFKLLFMTQFNSEDEMSDQVSMYFETLGELEEKDQEAMQAKYQKNLESLTRSTRSSTTTAVDGRQAV